MSNQSNESSFAGKSRITVDPNAGGNLIFTGETSEVKVLYLDPASAHAIEISTACAYDFDIRATKSSVDAIGKGRAIWGASSAYSNRDGDLFLGDVAAGVTAIEVTAVKTSGQTVSAAEAAAIGGNVEVRATKISGVTSGETALFATTRTEMTVDP